MYRKSKSSHVIGVRVSNETFDRLNVRAIRNKVSVGNYLKNWIDKELNR
jgi:predicted HicB family RNase H-like nuclease